MAVIKLKRSETAATTPTGLQYGEVAINITDKKIYIGNSSGATTLIVDGNAVGGGGGVSSFNTRTGAVTLTSSDVTTALGFTPTSYAAPTLGSTTLTSGTTITTIAGLTSVTSTSFTGALTGNASTVTNGVYTTDTGTVTNTMLAGSIANNKLSNSSITVNGSSISLGGSATITANTTNALTIGTGLSGTSFNGSSAVTIAIDSTVATLTGSQTLSNKTISGASNTLTNIGNSSLTNSSITVNGSSISLGGSATVTATATNSLTLGTGLTGTSYNGSTAVTAAVDTSTIATRSYVDSVAQGLHAHVTVNSATTAKLATLIGAGTGLAYNSGNKSITWTNGNAANDTHPNEFSDGVELTANTTEASASKILVKNEGDSGGLGAQYNGTYYVYGARELRRSSDGDTAAKWAGGDFVFVTAGTAYDNTGWVQLNTITILDTNALEFSQFSGAGTFTADETTLHLAGSVFSIKGSYVGQTSITTLGTIATGTWNGTTIGTGYGGTGLTTFTSGGAVYATSASVLTTGTLPTTAGGTGLSSYTAGDMLYYTSGTAFSKLAIGTNNYVLTSDGTNPVWTANTGTGSVVRASSPTLSTPTLGVASATSINKVAFTAPATGSTLTIADGKTLTASNTLTFTGTDSSSVAFGTGGTVAYTANKLSVFAATTSSELAGVISDETGSGALVFGTSPAFTTSITTGSTSFDAFNTTATTLNIGGACSVGLNLAVAATGTRVVNIATGAAGSRTINIANNKAEYRIVNLLSHNSFDQDYSVGGGAINALIGDNINTDLHYGNIEIGANATGAGGVDINYITIGTAGLSYTAIYGNIGVYDDGGFYVSSTNGSRDSIALIPRAGGVSSYTVNIIPTALSGTRTLTLPDATGTAITTGNLTSITTTGTITSGTWNGSVISEVYGGTNQSSYTLGDTLYSSASNTLSKLSGNTTTTKQFLSQTGTGTVSAAPSWSTVSKSDVGLSNVENTALSTWAGSTNITTLGTIGTGTWQGTAIGEIYGGTAQTSYAAGDLLYASATNTLSKLTKPSATSFLQMTSAGVPSWTDTIPTTDGGTGLTSFTSGGLLYASSTSALTTGSVFSVTVGGSSNLNRKINISTTVGTSIGYSASESTYGSSIFLGLESDFSGGISTYSNPVFKLNGATTNTFMKVEPSGLPQIAFTTTTYYPSYDGGVSLTWLQTEDNATFAKLILGYDYGGNTKITITDNVFSGCSMVIEAPTLQINTSTPAAGKVLTCIDSNGTVEWQASGSGVSQAFTIAMAIAL